MSYSHYFLVPAGPSAPKRSFHLSPSSLSLQLLPMPEEHLQRYSFTSRLCHRLLGGASSNMQGKSCVFLNGASSHSNSRLRSRFALNCWRLKASLLLSPSPEMRHPGMHSPKGSPQILHPARNPVAVTYQVTGRSDPRGEAIRSSGRSRATKRRGKARREAASCRHAWAHRQRREQSVL